MKNDAFFLRHILDVVNQIEEYTNITYEEFLETRLIQDGLLNRIMTVPPAAVCYLIQDA